MLVDLGEHVKVDLLLRSVQKETVVWFRSVLRPGMTVLDVGAHVGRSTLIAASVAGPTGRIHSFEPNALALRRLASNIELNGFQNIHLHPVALSNASGEATL